jgi:hypothetical protein
VRKLAASVQDEDEEAILLRYDELRAKLLG